MDNTILYNWFFFGLLCWLITWGASRVWLAFKGIVSGH